MRILLDNATDTYGHFCFVCLNSGFVAHVIESLLHFQLLFSVTATNSVNPNKFLIGKQITKYSLDFSLERFHSEGLFLLLRADLFLNG